MKALGYVLAVIGGLMVVSGLRLAVTKYDFQKTDDISQCVGGLAVSVFILIGGIVLIQKARNQHPK